MTLAEFLARLTWMPESITSRSERIINITGGRNSTLMSYYCTFNTNLHDPIKIVHNSSRIWDDSLKTTRLPIIHGKA